MLKYSLGTIFGLFEDNYVKKFDVEEYQLNQPTLESIFNTFAKEYYDEMNAERVTFSQRIFVKSVTE